MSTHDALRTLAELPGIGLWSATVVLLRGLGRLDVFPPGDVGAERGLRAVMHLGPEAPLGRVVERFGDQRGYLYFCALGGSLLEKGLIQGLPHRRERRSS
jgi:DNA-3-methyladenine glycosylase II